MTGKRRITNYTSWLRDETTVSAVSAVLAWPSWNDEYTQNPSILVSTATSASTVTIPIKATDGEWYNWNEQFRNIMIQTLHGEATTWASWNYNSTVANTYDGRFVSVTPAPDGAVQRIRDEQQRRREVEQQHFRGQGFRVSAEKIAAKEKAEKLLQSALAPEQREELKTRGFFHCRSKIGVVYRIYRGSHGNVKRLSHSGKEIESLCVQPAYVPEGDCMLAQKFHIEHNEEEFRRTANITQLN